jgi:insulysin
MAPSKKLLEKGKAPGYGASGNGIAPTKSHVKNSLAFVIALGIVLVSGFAVLYLDLPSVSASSGLASFFGEIAESFGIGGSDVKEEPAPIKSGLDEREFKYVKLENGLKALLVSDPTTDTVAAAMDIGFGSWDEPADIPGLAHFCEHMSFMGSKKYPNTQDYGQWISENGGSTNAYTSDESTNYYFGVQPAALESTLDRFSQFFISPLFSQSNVYKEMNAVNSENENDRNKDNWRVQYVLRNTANPEHPAHRATIGSISTLNRTDTRDRLITWHSKYYVAGAMKLVVLGRESIPDLEKMVAKLFKDVPPGDAPQHSWVASSKVVAYPPELTASLVKVETVVETIELAVHWSLQAEQTGGVDLTKNYRSNPIGLLALMLSSDSPRGLSSLLKAKGLAHGVSASSETNSAYTLLSISGELTPLGLKQYAEVTGIIFDYIHVLQSAPEDVLKARWDEIHLLEMSAYQYEEPDTTAGLASGLAANMQTMAGEDLLGSPEHFVWDGTVAKAVLASLTPGRAMVHLLSDKFHGAAELDQTEPWFGTKFSRVPLQEAVLTRLSKVQNQGSLGLPPPNMFLAQDLALLPAPEPPQPAARPELLRQEKGSTTPEQQIWWRQESTIPKVSFQAVLFSAASFASPRAVAMSRLYAHAVDDSMAEFRDMASIAGFSARVMPVEQTGLVFSISGYSDRARLLELAKTALHHMTAPNVTTSRWADLLSRTRQDVEAYKVWQPYEQAGYSERIFLNQEAVTVEQLQHEFAANVTLAEVRAFIPEMLQMATAGGNGAGLALQVLGYGNLDRAFTLALSDLVRTSLAAPAQPSTAGTAEQQHPPVGKPFDGETALEAAPEAVAIATAYATPTQERDATERNLYTAASPPGARAAADTQETDEAASPAERAFDAAFAKRLLSVDEGQAAPASSDPSPAQAAAQPMGTTPAVSAPLQRIIRPRSPVALRPGESLVYQAQSMSAADANNAVRSTYQLGKVTPQCAPSDTACGALEAGDSESTRTLAARMKRRLVMQVIDDMLGGGGVGGAVFEQLRSREQLGYIVASMAGVDGGIGSISFVVQGVSKDAAYMDGRVAKFIQAFYDDEVRGPAGICLVYEMV